MSANASYYQMRPDPFVTTPSRTNATPSRSVPEDNEYDVSPTDVACPPEHHTASYPEHVVRQTSANTPVHTFEENHNLAELLEAATTAAGQAAQAMEAHDAGSADVAAHGEARRKRASSSIVDDVAESSQVDAVVTPKRRRVDVPTDPQLQSTGHNSRGSSKSTSVGPSSESLLNDARAAGVHSAAALFRRTSEKTTTRKYTRPPMSRLFMSLQLSPENFLQLQAQAKTYMLNTTYPERQNCVGNRGKGDTDMVKLRLFNCVRDFLNDGVGEQFFGENVEKPGERDAVEVARALGEDTAPAPEERLTWPRDGNKIISLVTPLMRRMVTNERQRMYAIETRKGGSKKKDKEGSVEAVAQHVNHSASDHNTSVRSIELHSQPAFDPSLGKAYRISQPASPSVPIPNTPGPIPTADIVSQSGKVDDEPVEQMDLPLPSDGPTVPRLSNINIFLVPAPSRGSGDAAIVGIKLDQKRLTSDDADQLTNYSWDDLVDEVIKLLNRAKARYPDIRQYCVAQKTSPDTTEEPDDVTDNLRELAAAANAMQGDSIMTDTQAHAKKSASLSDSLLPRYIIKTVGPDGWEFVENEQQWNHLLLRRSREVWADGILNMVVELTDVRMEEKGKEGAKSESIPREG